MPLEINFYDSLPADEQRVHDLFKANSDFSDQQSFADFLNDSLRRGIALGNEWASAAARLDSMISRNRLSYPRELFRATSEVFVEPYIANGEYKYPAYMSTSVSDENLELHWRGVKNNRHVKLRIECPVGMPAAPMESKASFGGHENEILIGRKAVFEVLRRCEIFDKEEILGNLGGLYGKGIQSMLEYRIRFVRYD